MRKERPPQENQSSLRISAAERGVALACAVAVLTTFIFLVTNPRSMEGGTLAIVRFLAAIFAGIAGYLFAGNLGLEAKIPWNKTQIRATGAFAAFVLVLLFFFYGVPTSDNSQTQSNPRVKNVIGHSTNDRLGIEQVLISSFGTQYRLETTLNNGKAKEVLVTRIELYARKEDGTYCCCPPTTEYVISDKFILNTDKDKPKIEGAATQKGSQFSYPVNGSFQDNNCGDFDLTLEFDTSILIPANKYSSFFILIPKNLKLVKKNYPFVTNISSFSSISEFDYKQLYIWVNTEEKIIKAKIDER